MTTSRRKGYLGLTVSLRDRSLSPSWPGVGYQAGKHGVRAAAGHSHPNPQTGSTARW